MRNFDWELLEAAVNAGETSDSMLIGLVNKIHELEEKIEVLESRSHTHATET